MERSERVMKTSAEITTTGTIANNRASTSLCLAKYVQNIQQAGKKTATEYQYRLSKFERYIAAILELPPPEEKQLLSNSIKIIMMKIVAGQNSFFIFYQ
jgi:hypothetical protein